MGYYIFYAVSVLLAFFCVGEGFLELDNGHLMGLLIILCGVVIFINGYFIVKNRYKK